MAQLYHHYVYDDVLIIVNDDRTIKVFDSVEGRRNPAFNYEGWCREGLMLSTHQIRHYLIPVRDGKGPFFKFKDKFYTCKGIQSSFRQIRSVDNMNNDTHDVKHGQRV